MEMGAAIFVKKSLDMFVLDNHQIVTLSVEMG